MEMAFLFMIEEYLPLTALYSIPLKAMHKNDQPVSVLTGSSALPYNHEMRN